MAHSKPRVVVGLDFGTTFSGFAFAHTSDPDQVYTFFDYPKAGTSKPYCKTLTGSYYKNEGGAWHLKSWGYPARAEAERDILTFRKQRTSDLVVGTYFTRFKLHLAPKDMTGASSAQDLLPLGMTVSALITDYLREMGGHILKKLQGHFGEQLSKQAIQWCITVPSIWDNAAKATMKACMISAGLVAGDDGSHHPLIMVLEPEAASLYCHKLMSSELDLHVGDKILVADVGGGTSDIVVQEVVSVGESGYFRVTEATTSSGGLCGGAYVDARFMEFLHKTIGPPLRECLSNQRNIYSHLMQPWEHIKADFGDVGTMGECTDINLPVKVAKQWEEYNRRMGIPERDSYDEVEISYQEMQSIFDPVVEQNLRLIAHQLEQVGGVRVVVVVGGFAGSPYLMERIRKRFAGIVPHIISPPNPGSAVCQGAVMLALNPETVLSRLCKRTYGIEVCEHFDESVDPLEYREVVDGVSRCKNRFLAYIRKGDTVEGNSCISTVHCPLRRGQKSLLLTLFSSDETDPRYTVGETVRKEAEIVIDISMDMELEKRREVKVSCFFGRSSIEVKAEAVNFSCGGPQQLELPIEVGFC